MTNVNREQAHQDPCCHVFSHGRGYVHVGRPALPARCAHAPARATPPAPVADGSWHVLTPPHGGHGVAMQWSGPNSCWLPVLGTGNRLGFSPEYLAAHGWVYRGPRPAVWPPRPAEEEAEKEE